MKTQDQELTITVTVTVEKTETSIRYVAEELGVEAGAGADEIKQTDIERRHMTPEALADRRAYYFEKLAAKRFAQAVWEQLPDRPVEFLGKDVFDVQFAYDRLRDDASLARDADLFYMRRLAPCRFGERWVAPLSRMLHCPQQTLDAALKGRRALPDDVRASWRRYLAGIMVHEFSSAASIAEKAIAEFAPAAADEAA